MESQRCGFIPSFVKNSVPKSSLIFSRPITFTGITQNDNDVSSISITWVVALKTTTNVVNIVSRTEKTDIVLNYKP